MLSVLRSVVRVCRIAERDLLGATVRSPDLVINPDTVGAWCIRCGASIVSARVTRACKKCAGRKQHRAFTIRVGSHDGGLRDGVLALKHHGDRAAGKRVAKALAQQCRATGLFGLESSECAVTGVPMPFARWCERGIDHAGVIAREVARTLDLRFVRLLEQEEGPTQASLTAPARRRRAGRFRLRSRPSVPHGLAVLLVVDDVLTTGSTVESIARLILGAGVAQRVGAAVVTVADPWSPQ